MGFFERVENTKKFIRGRRNLCFVGRHYGVVLGAKDRSPNERDDRFCIDIVARALAAGESEKEGEVESPFQRRGDHTFLFSVVGCKAEGFLAEALGFRSVRGLYRYGTALFFYLLGFSISGFCALRLIEIPK
jgi:hypothetical protein